RAGIARAGIARAGIARAGIASTGIASTGVAGGARLDREVRLAGEACLAGEDRLLLVADGGRPVDLGAAFEPARLLGPIGDGLTRRCRISGGGFGRDSAEPRTDTADDD